MLRVAIVGISGYGSFLTEILRKFALDERIIFTAATVINRDEESARCEILHAEKVRIFEDHREMLRVCGSEIDLCVVPVGIPWHTKIAVDVLRSGCHLFLEKPIAGSYADAARICKTAKLHKRHLIVGFQDLSDPGVWEIKEALLSGAVGDVLEIRAAGAWPRPLEYFVRNSWAGKLIVEGTLVRDSPHNNALSHLVNLSLFWAGRSQNESAWPTAVQGRLYRFLPIESFDTGWIEWNLNEGPRVICAASHASKRILPPQIHILGSSGSLLWNYETGLADNDILSGQFPRPDVLALREMVLDAAFEVVQGVPAYHCSAENALAHAKAIDLVHSCLPIQSSLTAEVLIDHRLEGEYHFVRGMEEWCNSALSSVACPEIAEFSLTSAGRFDPALK